MNYAIIENGIVDNIVVADLPLYDNWIETETAAVGWSYSDGVFNAPIIITKPEEPKPYTTFIDKGPFNDRFGAKKLMVLMSADPVIKAFNSDKSDREYIDLARDDVRAAVAYMAGVAIPGIGAMAEPILTLAEVGTILDTPVATAEQSALIKKFWS